MLMKLRVYGRSVCILLSAWMRQWLNRYEKHSMLCLDKLKQEQEIRKVGKQGEAKNDTRKAA
jgi:hypothetical protein